MDTRLAIASCAAVVVVAASFAMAQTPPPADDPDAAAPPLPPPPELGPAVEAPPQIVKPKPPVRAVEHAAPIPPPPAVLRSPMAVLQVLDKVTAETLRFEAPVGRRVRYKTLVVEVKACETRGYADPAPRASAYLIVDTRSAPIQASQIPEDHEMFRGWAFAFTPALHAVEHPIYDLWLVACGAAAPAT